MNARGQLEMGNGQSEGAKTQSVVDAHLHEPGEFRDYRDLNVWQLSMELSTSIYEATARFPEDERFGLTSQLRRASVSVPANIAEGYGRNSRGAYVQFLKIAQGSLKELETLIELARRLAFLNEAKAEDLLTKSFRNSKMLRSLIRSIEGRP